MLNYGDIPIGMQNPTKYLFSREHFETINTLFNWIYTKLLKEDNSLHKNFSRYSDFRLDNLVVKRMN